MQLILFVVGLIPPALLKQWVRWRFKTVPQQTPLWVARALISEPVLLLDVRSPYEFAAAHLATAINVNHDLTAQQLIQQFRANAPDGQVVAYCTVGHRSCQFAERMASMGCSDIKNLEGGIWAWTAAGLATTNTR